MSASMISPRGGGLNSLDSSFNSAMSTLGRPGSTDVTDSSTIRQAIYDDWNARKTLVLKEKKKQQRRLEKEEEERKQKVSLVKVFLSSHAFLTKLKRSYR